MIHKNITRRHILKAIQEIRKVGVHEGRESRKFLLEFEGKEYPPKYAISLANKYANGKELNPEKFSGGNESNEFLRNLGFKIRQVKGTDNAEKPAEKHLKEYEPREYSHDERCPKCKETVHTILEKIYGKAEHRHKFEVGATPEAFRNTPYYQTLREIFEVLQRHRGFKEFVKAPTLPNCDFFMPDPGLIVEFDESQHFTLPRKIALEHYPEKLELGFDRKKWIRLCERINAKDSDPPYRDEQRAWYDTLRDFLPALLGLKPTIRLYATDYNWCHLKPKSSGDVGRFKEFLSVKRREAGDWIATVIIQSDEEYSNSDRLEATSQIIEKVSKETKGDGIIVFPAGWFNSGNHQAREKYEWAEENLKQLLRKEKKNIIACLGVDGRTKNYLPKDQIGLAITREGIEDIARKFYPTKYEKAHIQVARDHIAKEEGKNRVFELKGKRYFIWVCYDGFGIKHNKIQNLGVSAVIDLIHGFYPKGEEGSGEVNFARHGLAGASNQLQCPVFCADVFFRREIPGAFPSGVYWNKGNTHSPKCTYDRIIIEPANEIIVKIKEGGASVRIFSL